MKNSIKIKGFECIKMTKWDDIYDLSSYKGITLIFVGFIDDYIILYGVQSLKYYAINDNF